jgi:hypothetical protein
MGFKRIVLTKINCVQQTAQLMVPLTIRKWAGKEAIYQNRITHCDSYILKFVSSGQVLSLILSTGGLKTSVFQLFSNVWRSKTQSPKIKNQ